MALLITHPGVCLYVLSVCNSSIPVCVNVHVNDCITCTLSYCARGAGTSPTGPTAVGPKLRRPKWFKIHSCKKSVFCIEYESQVLSTRVILIEQSGLNLWWSAFRARKLWILTLFLNLCACFARTCYLAGLMLTCFRHHCVQCMTILLSPLQHFQLLLQVFVLTRFEPSLVFLSQIASQAIVSCITTKCNV